MIACHLESITMDTETPSLLLNCALVCRTWAHLVHKYQFSHVRLLSFSALVKYEATVRRSPYLSTLVRKLFFDPILTGSTDNDDLEGKLPNAVTRTLWLAHRLPRIQELTIWIGSQTFINEHPNVFRLARIITICTLRVHSISLVPLIPLIRFIRSFASLTTLDLDVPIEAKSIPLALYQHSGSLRVLSLKPSLGHGVITYDYLISWFARAGDFCSQLQSLSLPMEDIIPSRELLDSVDELLARCCLSLKSLSFESLGDVSPPDPLPSFPQRIGEFRVTIYTVRRALTL